MLRCLIIFSVTDFPMPLGGKLTILKNDILSFGLIKYLRYKGLTGTYLWNIFSEKIITAAPSEKSTEDIIDTLEKAKQRRNIGIGLGGQAGR